MVPPRLTRVSEHAFSPAERRAVYRVIAERRDMRRFVARLRDIRRGAGPTTARRTCRTQRRVDAAMAVHPHHRSGTPARYPHLVDEERLRTADALGPRSDEFLALKVEGILECAELFVVALATAGRPTCSAGARCRRWTWHRCRARSRTCGWPRAPKASAWAGCRSSIPRRLADLLAMPEDAEPVAILCLGPVPDFPDRPALETRRVGVRAPAAASSSRRTAGSRRRRPRLGIVSP